MLATLTSKGQITLPKEIRDRLQLGAGDVLDFVVLPDNSLQVRAVTADARRIRGLLRSPHLATLSVPAMDRAVDEAVQGRRGGGAAPQKAKRK